jgi:serine/threonine-protein kinase
VASIDKRYVLRERLGSGGMSQVWRADDEVLGRPVAVKLLTTDEPSVRTAIWTEARAVARLTHPHVAHVYDYGQETLPDGSARAYLVMELVDGGSLADRLRSGPLPWPQAVATGGQVAAALAAAHRIGVVHRDVKPGNVMLTRTGAKVLDFGIAALAGDQPDGGRLVGTPAYAAPEQLRPGPAIPQSDVYALGVLLHEMLTGRLPGPVATWQVPGLPRQVLSVGMACLSPDPAERPAADHVAQVLAHATGSDEPTALVPVAGYAVGSARLPHPPTMLDLAPPVPLGDVHTASRRPLLLGLIVAIVLLVVALAGVTAALLSRPASPSATASPPATTPAPAVSSPPPAASTAPATTVAGIADAIDAVIANALAAGTIDADAAGKLRDEVDKLRERRGKKQREQVGQLRQTIGELADHGNLDQNTAAQLVALLQPLTGND